MRVINIANPAHPYELSRIVTRDHTPDVQVSGSYGYLAACYRIMIVDISDPFNPTEVAYHPVPTPSYGITCVGSLIYVATIGTSLQIYESTLGVEENGPVLNCRNGLLNVIPNPSRSNVKICLAPTARIGHLDPRKGGSTKDAQQILIYECSGRLVRKLPVANVVIWDRKDNNGRSVPAGIYFACVDNEKLSLTSIVLIE